MSSSKGEGWFDGVREGLSDPSTDGGASPLGAHPRYEVLERLGEGATSSVYRAHDRKLNRPVALKILKPELAQSEQARTRFLREAQTVARLSHPNLVLLYDSGEANGRLYLAMELVRGEPLSRILERRKHKLRPMVELLAKVAGGLEEAHERKVVHRDVKPSNILVAEKWEDGPSSADAQEEDLSRATEGSLREATREKGACQPKPARDSAPERRRRLEPKLADFGLARLEDTTTALTRSGASMGTPLYMSPEQVEGRPEAIGPWTDVYGLGAVLYEMLTGHPPHLGGTVQEVYQKILFKDPTPPRKLRPDVPVALEAICLKALEKSGSRRYASAGRFGKDLQRYLKGEEVTARRTTAVTRIWRKAVRNRKVVLPVAMAGIVTFAAGVYGLVNWGRGADLDEARERTQRILREKAKERELTLAVMRENAAEWLEGALAERRKGNLKGMESFANAQRRAYERAVKIAPSAAELDYLMGRMERALMRRDKALVLQDAALAKEPDHVPALYERALLGSLLYFDRAKKLQEQAWAEEGRRMAATQGELRKPASQRELVLADPVARELLEKFDQDVARLSKGSTKLGPGETLYLRALKAPEEEAVGLLKEAIDHAPLLEEAYHQIASLEFRRGRMEEAIRWWGAGIERDRGYITHYLNRGAAYHHRGSTKAGRGEDPAADYEAATRDYDEALNLDPENVEIWYFRGCLNCALGKVASDGGRDPSKHYRRALEDISKVLDRAPERGDLWQLRGLTRNNWASDVERRGQDPTDLCKGAIADLVHSVTLNPDDQQSWGFLGLARLGLGEYVMSCGADASTLLREAVEDYSQALKRYPGNPASWTFRGITHMRLGECRRDRGAGDPWESYESALKDLTQAIELGKGVAKSWHWRGNTRADMAITTAARGEDCGPHFREALTDFGRALQLNPVDSETWRDRGLTYVSWADARGKGAKNGEGLLKAALDDLTKSIKLNPIDVNTWEYLGRARERMGDLLRAEKREARSEYEEALKAYTETVRMRPSWKARLQASIDACRQRSGK